MFSPIPDAFHTRQTLTPYSESSLNSDTFLEIGVKKRKRVADTAEDFLKDPFAVTPYPAKCTTRPRTLQPLLLLPRSHLPLSSLDLNASSRPLPNSRFFETDVKILDLEERMGSEPMVVIARLDDGLTLYAVERQDRGLYVLCQLGSWVNIQQLRAVAAVSRQEVKALEKSFGSGGTITVPLVPEASSVLSKRKRLAIDAVVSMVKRPCTGAFTETPASAEPIPLPQLQPKMQLPASEPTVDEIHTQLTATEIFETVRNQYFEALYLSQASLAYFTKGPLSRARAAFHLDYDSTLDMNEYITFLESVILSTNIIEKKYKDGLPTCVSEIDMHDDSAEDAKGKKKRTSKKMKPGKSGLYPLEDGLVRRWWAEHDDEIESGAPGSSREQIQKSRIAQLRIRETQLQIIMILEVLALQPLAATMEDTTANLPNSLPGVLSNNLKESPAKIKKTTHLTTLIDVHIDRLCIWQSLDFAVETPIEAPSDTKGKLDGLTSKRYTDNILRDFCVDIIGPFFSSRLPEKCAAINLKLGGPVTAALSLPKLPKSASFSGAPTKPGAATKRAVPAKPRRSLQRVLTDDRERRSGSIGLMKAPGLLRSATDPVKREGSEAPSLTGIPQAVLKPQHKDRNGILASKQFSRREVDMKRLAPDFNSKAIKQAKANAELKEAIQAIKKPNRELAGKSLAETAQRRAFPGPQGRKSKKPVRNPLFEGVQITATPKANRQKDMFGSSKRSSLPSMADEMDAVILPSSAPRIPQSVIRPRVENTRNPLQSTIHATPTRRSSSAAERSNGMLGVPVADYGALIQATPTRKSSLAAGRSNGILGVPVVEYGVSIQATPTRKSFSAPESLSGLQAATAVICVAYPSPSPLQQRHSGFAQNYGAVQDSITKDTSSSRIERGIQETPIKKRLEAMAHVHPTPFTSSNNENTKTRA